MSESKRQSPSVTMSSPAISCSRRYTDKASTYCSRNFVVTIASRNDRVPRFSVYQLGRGSDPITVVGSTLPAVALNIPKFSLLNVFRFSGCGRTDDGFGHCGAMNHLIDGNRKFRPATGC